MSRKKNEREDPIPGEDRELLRAGWRLLKEIVSYCHRALLSNSRIQEYLKDRGVSSSELERFQVGYYDQGLKDMIPKEHTECARHLGILDKSGREALPEHIIFPVMRGRAWASGTARHLRHTTRLFS